MRHQCVEDIRRQAPGAAHAFEGLGPVELDYSVARFDAVVSGDGNILGHRA